MVHLHISQTYSWYQQNLWYICTVVRSQYVRKSIQEITRKYWGQNLLSMVSIRASVKPIQKLLMSNLPYVISKLPSVSMRRPKDLPSTQGIYFVTGTPERHTERIFLYVGQTTNFQRRWCQGHTFRPQQEINVRLWRQNPFTAVHSGGYGRQ